MIYTSNFARIKRLPPDVRPVSIARLPPYWFRGLECLDLAPTEEMLHADIADYKRQFEAILARFDPREMVDAILVGTEGHDAALLCWCGAGIRCHRRRVAEWIETALGVTVPEHGFERHEIPPYDQLPPKKGRR